MTDSTNINLPRRKPSFSITRAKDLLNLPVHEVEQRDLRRREYEAPRNPLEKKLQELWEEILNVEKIGINDAFIDLGGNSLDAARLVSKIHKLFEVRIQLSEIFEGSTIKGLARCIEKAAKEKYKSIEPVEKKEYYILSAAQKRLYLLQQMEPENTNYNVSILRVLEGQPAKKRLENAFKELIRRHESLRMSFELVDGKPVQRIHDEVEFEIEYYNVERRAESVEQGESAIRNFVRAFDLSKAPLLRVGVIRSGENRDILMVDIHHIAADGTSMDILVRDFMMLFEREGARLPFLRIRYRDYAEWQSRDEQKEAEARQEQFWLRELAGELPVLHLPYDYPRPAVQRFEGDRVAVEIGEQETARLAELANSQDATLYMMLLAIFNVLFSKLSGQEEIIMGTALAGRRHADLQNVIGMLVNTLALRNDPSGGKSFLGFLNQLKEKTLAAFENQDYPFENLVEKLCVARDTGRSPLFDVIFSLQNFNRHSNERPVVKPEDAANPAATYDYDFGRAAAKFDLTILGVEAQGKLFFTFEYCSKLFKKETIKRFGGFFKKIVASVLGDPGRRISDIEIISGEEKDRVLYEFNNTAARYPGDKTIPQLFEEQVLKTPGTTALVFKDRELTYNELNSRVNQVAGVLRERGTGPDIIIGLAAERSLEMIIGILGILKAGGTYLPIDTKYPQERIYYILSDSQVKLLLAASPARIKVKEESVEIIKISDLLSASTSPASSSNLTLTCEDSSSYRLPSPGSLAYVIYTSGSTGRPKGVGIDQYSVLNRLNWMQRAYPLAGNDRILQKTPIVFDVSVWELFWWFYQGALLVLLEPGEEKNPEVIVRVIRRYGITILHFVPSMLNAFLDYIKTMDQCRDLASIHQVFASGEALGAHQVRQFNQLLYTGNGTRLINLYGPTEATVDVSFFDCDLNEEQVPGNIPIGKPIDSVRLLIFDRYRRVQPIGIAGELCISGVGLGRGYINRPELTAEKFVLAHSSWFIADRREKEVSSPGEHPMSCELSAMSCFYKTGDLARWLPDGNIEFLGRRDHQVKIRGFRIELGEIEKQIMNFPPVREAVVVQLQGTKDKSDQPLAAYIVPDPHHGFVASRMLKLKQEGILTRQRQVELPNGMTVVYLNRHETDYMYREIFQEQTYLKHGITLEKGACVFDVGANIGMFSLFINRLCEDADIYAFEPVPPVFELLSINTAIYGNQVKVFAHGLGDRAADMRFTYYPHASVLSGYYADGEEEKITVAAYMQNLDLPGDDEVAGAKNLMDELLEERLAVEDFTCPIKTLSQVIRENEIEGIDLLKIDVEKSEIDVLKGIAAADWEKIRQLVIEVHNVDGRLEWILHLLEKKGYRMVVEQESELADTEIYNVYALKGQEREGENREAAVKENERALMEYQRDCRWWDPRRLRDDLKKRLENALPDYMVPTFMVLLAEMPMTPNGKLDRRALPAPDLEEGAGHASPTNALERQLLAIWADVLGLRERQISIDSNFFAIGGHSLSAVNLVSRIHRNLHIKLALKHVFEMPTIRRLALHLQGMERQEYISIEMTEQKEYYTLSSAQRRMFILQQLDLLSTKYNMPFMVPLENEVNREKLENAFRKLMVRHEILRTSIGVVNHEPVQMIHDNVEFSLQYHEVAAAGLDREEEQGGIEAAAKEVLRHFVRPFDLSRPPFLRAALIHTGPHGHILVIDMHHTISDERTMEIIGEEIQALYQDQELPPLTLQYKDYSRWQNLMSRGGDGQARGILAQQEVYWLKKFAGDLPILALPTDYPRPEVQDFKGGYISFEISRQHTHAVGKLAESLNATIYMVLLAAYNILLAKLSGQEDIIIGTPVKGRRHSELDKLVGMFINMLPMRNFPEMNKTFEEFLTEVKANALADFDNQDYPFDELVAKLGIKKTSHRSPLFDAAFLFQSPKRSIMEDTEAEEPPGDLPEHEYKTTFSRDDFQHNISYAELGLFSYQLRERIKFEFKYHTALFKQKTVEKMARYYKNILEQVVANPAIRLAELQLFSLEKYNGFASVEVGADADISESKEKIEADFEF